MRLGALGAFYLWPNPRRLHLNPRMKDEGGGALSIWSYFIIPEIGLRAGQSGMLRSVATGTRVRRRRRRYRADGQ